MGWFTCIVVVAGLAIAAWQSVERAVCRWWDGIAIAVLAALLIAPLYETITGDISRLLPWFLWSDGPDGKDQIILASAASTLLLPVVAAGWLWRACRALRSRLAS